MGSFTLSWSLVVLGALAAAVANFILGVNQRQDRLMLAVRIAAGLASIAVGVFIVVGGVTNLLPTSLHWYEKFALGGVFIFLVLFIPSVIERNREQDNGPTIQERAARPTNATIRLRDTNVGADEWVN